VIIMNIARTGSKRIYTVDNKIHETNCRLFGENWKCQYCDERFQKGDNILAMYNRNIKWYHKKCYDLTLYDA